MSFGKKLKKLRTDRGITQLQLSEILDTAKSNISKYEADTIEPNISTLCKIANYFHVSADYLLDISDSKLRYSSQRNDANSGIHNSILVNHWISKTGIGYDDIAGMLGIDEELLDAYCSGESPIPLSILSKISEICGVSTDCILGFRDKSRRKNSDGEMPFNLDPEISHRLKERAATMGESYSQIAALLGIEEIEVFNFFEYGFVPHITIFVKIVEHFLVSSDYLLNRTSSTLTVQSDEDELLRSFRSLNTKSKTMALSRIYELEREESLVAAKDRYLDKEGKSLPSNGTGGGTMVG